MSNTREPLLNSDEKSVTSFYSMPDLHKYIEQAYLQLSTVLNLFGYIKTSQKEALIRLAAYRGCFDEKYKGKILTESEINLLLQKTFTSLEEGINWWVEVTQKNWLRSTFHIEGTNGKDLTVNMKRWDSVDHKIDDSTQKAFLTAFDHLDLIEPAKCYEEKITHVAIHGGLEKFVRERIDYIKDFNGTLYYLTNPRGLFNDEPSLASILAKEWFDDPTLEVGIRSVLEEHKNLNNSDKNWLKDLNGLKKLILQKTGKSEWPTQKGWYYQHPKVFEESCKQDKRQSLADWPTAMDMVDFLIKQRAAKEKGLFTHINLQPVYSIRPGRIATTENLVEDFYEQHLKKLTTRDKCIFVSNNSLNLHYIPFQNTIVEEVLYKLNLRPGIDCFKFVTIGPGASELSLSAGTDALAKLFYTKKDRILALLKNPKEFLLLDDNTTLSELLSRIFNRHIGTPIQKPLIDKKGKQTMQKYNIAFTPEKESLEQFIKYAKTLPVKHAEYMLGDASYPHVTICHFEANLDELADIIKKFTALKQGPIELTFTTQRNKTYPTHPKWGQWSWISLISDKLDELKKIHLAVAEIVKPTNAAFDNYDPHLTLLNSRDHQECSKTTSSVGAALTAKFNFVLGKLDEVGQVTEIVHDCTDKFLQLSNTSNGEILSKIGLNATLSSLSSNPLENPNKKTGNLMKF